LLPTAKKGAMWALWTASARFDSSTETKFRSGREA